MNRNNTIRFILNNIGPISNTEIELNNMTVITGKNSVSKTYITYLIFGFLDYIKSVTVNKDWQKEIARQLATPVARIAIQLPHFAKSIQTFINNIAFDYSREIYKLLSFDSDSDILKNCSFNVLIDNLFIDYKKPLCVSGIQITQNIKIELNKINGSGELEIVLVVENKAKFDKNLYELISSYITKYIISYFIGQIFPLPFIVTSERTGVSIFYRELDTSRNTLIDTLQQNRGMLGRTSDSLIKKHIARYPLPIKLNMDFIRNIFDISKNKTTLKPSIKSFISKQISNGKYTFDKNLNQIFFIPKTSHKVKLPIHSTSSSVKSLLLFDAYVNFVADSGQILIIDEPELNLHPDNQRKMARFLTMLTNAGVKVLFTTHSDYLIKELNNLIMLHELDSQGHQKSIINHFNKKYNSGYTEDMLIKQSMVNCYTIIEKDQNFHAYKSYIDRYGINLALLDDEINNLSEISQILFTELENDYYK